jgi:hypothetical protein
MSEQANPRPDPEREGAIFVSQWPPRFGRRHPSRMVDLSVTRSEQSPFSKSVEGLFTFQYP